jgi:hypothetical protein
MKSEVHECQLQDGKNRFSKPVKRARRPRHESLVDYLLSGPRWPDDLVEQINDRARDIGRDPE